MGEDKEDTGGGEGEEQAEDHGRAVEVETTTTGPVQWRREGGRSTRSVEEGGGQSLRLHPCQLRGAPLIA